MRPTVVVLGMHRSGTSCLAGSLQARGLDLGAVSTSDPHNELGNRESLEVRHINEEVLAQSGGSWLSPPDGVRWDRALAARRDQFLAGLGEGAEPWGFKDPRTLLTLPFWLEALAAPRFVATFRHPLAVAESLRMRNGLSREAGLGLWLAYNDRLAALWRGTPFPVVRFDVDPAAYRARLDAVAAELGLGGAPADGDFRDERLVHHGQEVDDRDPAIGGPQADLLRRLVDMAGPP